MIAVGAFLIVLAPMIRFYVYPHVAVAPENQRSVTGLEAKGATVFDAASLKEIQTDLAIEVNTVGVANPPEGKVTYVNTTVTTDSAGSMVAFVDGRKIIRGEVERMTFDARTGEADPKAEGDFISDAANTQKPIHYSGLVAKFPFETEKKTYNFWDSTLAATVPISYVETTKIEDMEVYKFSQVVPPTKVDEIQLPVSLLGGQGSEQATGEMMYSVDRTLWVEPHTGVIIKRVEAQDNTIDYQGVPQITTTKAVVTYDEKTVRKNIDDYGSQGTMLNLVRNVVPQVLFVVGLLMLIGGIFLGRRKATPAPAAPEKEFAGAHR
ncbi:MAG: DUF3068 domain-containing protein [Propionibacteriales bacterium]|nr:DUF3068 domain-containing protein [Propionibacteriales bacterium]